MKRVCIFMILLFAWAARAEVIEFPEEELASESVVPVFDQPTGVRNRSVVTDRRFELGGFVGWTLTEPLFNPLNFGGNVTYHLNEAHAFNVHFNYWLSGTSDYSKQLNEPEVSTQPLNLQLVPAPKWLGLFNYQYTAFYGKLSLAKSYIMNLSLYSTTGLGMIAIGEETRPVFSVGLGQKFYFNRHLALRADMRVLVYQGPNPVSRNLSNQTTVQPASSFEQQMVFSSLLTVGAVYLIPNS